MQSYATPLHPACGPVLVLQGGLDSAQPDVLNKESHATRRQQLLQHCPGSHSPPLEFIWTLRRHGNTHELTAYTILSASDHCLNLGTGQDSLQSACRERGRPVAHGAAAVQRQPDGVGGGRPPAWHAPAGVRPRGHGARGGAVHVTCLHPPRPGEQL